MLQIGFRFFTHTPEFETSGMVMSCSGTSDEDVGVATFLMEPEVETKLHRSFDLQKTLVTTTRSNQNTNIVLTKNSLVTATC